MRHFCNISINSELASNIRQGNLITWDEIVMCLRNCVEAVDRTPWAIMKHSNVLFSGRFFYSVVISDKSPQRIENSDCIYDTEIFSPFSSFTLA